LDPDILTTNSKLREEILDDLWAYSYFINPEQILDSMRNILQTGVTTNQHIAEICDSYPDRFVGFGSVNPSKSKKYVFSKLDEILSLGLKGIKLIPTLQFFHPQKNKNIKTIFNFATKQNWPILIHTGKDPGPFEIHTLRYVQYSHPRYWKKSIKKTKTKIIFAHLGGYGVDDDESWINSALEIAKIHPNVFLDTSAVTYALESIETVAKLRNLGFERILFGSDHPVVHGTSMEHSKKIIQNSPLLTDEEKQMILVENAHRLFSD
ncbi:MAG: amidohydrolase family protein, partial [Promethearchaeota archaeon]